MRRATLALVAMLAVAGCGGTTAATPTHVTALFVDGLNNGDARQTCQQVRIPKGQTLQACEAYYTQLVAQLEFFGTFGSYRVVGHSVEQWREGDARVARVSVTSTQDKTTVLHVRLVKGKHGWKIVDVT